jgi:hypothetical protein
VIGLVARLEWLVSAQRTVTGNGSKFAKNDGIFRVYSMSNGQKAQQDQGPS